MRLADPLLRFEAAVIRPDLARFEARRTAEAWAGARPAFDAQVVGPHFEALAREWTSTYAATATLGGDARQVGFAQINDATARQRFELDVVAIGRDPRHILAIGVAKGGEARRGIADLRRLERLRILLATRAHATDARLLLFGRAGFARDLVSAAQARADVELIDLERLYEGE